MQLLKVFLAIGVLVFNAGIKAETLSAGKPVDIVVYRSPTCNCCGKWHGTFEKK